MKKHQQDHDLFEAWREPDEPTTSEEPRPSDAEIFDAVMLNTSLERRREIILHLARCSDSAESWRLAMELKPPAEVVDLSSRHARKAWRNLPAWGLAAAAVLVMVIGVFWIMPTPDPGFPEIGDGNTFRGDSEHAIELITADGLRLPAEDFELRWNSIDQIEEYRVLITTTDLEAVFSAATQTTSLRVPSAALSSIESTEPLYWYVTALRRDGSILRSSTQTVFVGDQ
ncbi:MAG: hypothetical protein AAF446_01435 [Pseudomonadota bacterium]